MTTSDIKANQIIIEAKDDNQNFFVSGSDGTSDYYGHLQAGINIIAKFGANANFILSYQKSDNLYLKGNIEDYQFQRQGSTLIISDARYSTHIKLAVNKTADHLIFKNGSVDIQYTMDSKKNYYMDFGGKKLTTELTSFKSTSLKNFDKTTVSISQFDAPVAMKSPTLELASTDNTNVTSADNTLNLTSMATMNTSLNKLNTQSLLSNSNLNQLFG